MHIVFKQCRVIIESPQSNQRMRAPAGREEGNREGWGLCSVHKEKGKVARKWNDEAPGTAISDPKCNQTLQNI